MPFLHLDARNEHKEQWYELVKDHPAKFEILEWNPEQDQDLIYRSYPNIDIQLFPRYCCSILAALHKLVDYGGICVRGNMTKPTREVKILLEDWKTLGSPKKFTVRGYTYPVSIDKTRVMASKVDDIICRMYRDQMVENMLKKLWEHPTFGSDVLIM